jgi:CRP-like cAMP-binding protein
MYQSKMDVIGDSMRAMNISPRLQRKTVAYYELLWKRQRALTTNNSFIDELSPPLRKELNMDLNTEVIYRCELFKRLLDRDDESLSGIMSEETSDHILVAIVNALQREVFLPGDTLIQQGEIGEEMFFLVRGLISIEKMLCLTTTDENDRKKVEYKNQEIAKLKAGSYFGELALLREGDRSKQRRAASCIALTDCDARILRKETFNTVCEDFPELRLYLQSEADRKYAQFNKNKPAETKESKAGPTESASKPVARRHMYSNKVRRDSIAMALTQKSSTISINRNLGASKLEFSDEDDDNRTLGDAATKGDVLALSRTLDALNSRLGRLEVHLENLGTSVGVSVKTTAAPTGAIADVKPPTPLVGGSAGRRILTSPAAINNPRSPSATTLVSPSVGAKRGWGALRNSVRAAEDTKSVQSPKRVDSGFSWT